MEVTTAVTEVQCAKWSHQDGAELVFKFWRPKPRGCSIAFLRSLVTAISSYLWFFVNSWWCVSPQGCLGLIYSTVGGGGERDLLSICDILFNCYRCWFSARFTLNYFILLITLLCMSRSSVIHKTATATLYQKTELLTVATFGYFPNYSVSLKCNYKTDYGN